MEYSSGITKKYFDVENLDEDVDEYIGLTPEEKEKTWREGGSTDKKTALRKMNEKSTPLQPFASFRRAIK